MARGAAGRTTAAMHVTIEYCVPCGHLERAIGVERELLSHLHAKHQGLLDKIRVEKDLKNAEDDLKSVLAAFAATFA